MLFISSRWEYGREWHSLHEDTELNTLEEFEKHYASLDGKEKNVSSIVYACEFPLLTMSTEDTI